MLEHPVPRPSAPDLPAPVPALRLYDGLAPFFLGHTDESVNWSKIPFRRLERDGRLDPAAAEAVLRGFDAHVAAMAELRETVGGEWVRTYGGDLDAPALREALAWAEETPRHGTRPLRELDWDGIGRQTALAYRTVMNASPVNR